MKGRDFPRLLKQSILHFLYPHQCVNCRELVYDYPQKIFCPSCTILLELLDPNDRCPTCFSNDYHVHLKRCAKCKHGSVSFSALASVFEYQGPPSALIKRLKYGNQMFLAKGAAAFMVAKLMNLDWPKPDALVPVPLPFTRWLQRGYNQSLLLAEEMGLMMDVPVWDILKRRSGDYSQAGLSLEQRKLLQNNKFELKKKNKIADKTILLIDDVMTTGSTLKRCAETLAEGYPAKMYALTFCRAETH